jgi:hypothetical protein
MGLPPWSANELVHLTTDGYGNLALVITDSTQVGQACDTASVSGSGSEGQKRRVPESVVTRPPVPPPKIGRGAAPVRVAGWLVGRMEGVNRGGGRNLSPQRSHGGGSGWRVSFRWPPQWWPLRTMRMGRQWLRLLRKKGLVETSCVLNLVFTCLRLAPVPT